MHCITCGMYFRQYEFNQSEECEDCVDVLPGGYDPVYEADVYQILHPSGKTPCAPSDE